MFDQLFSRSRAADTGSVVHSDGSADMPISNCISGELGGVGMSIGYSTYSSLPSPSSAPTIITIVTAKTIHEDCASGSLVSVVPTRSEPDDTPAPASTGRFSASSFLAAIFGIGIALSFWTPRHLWVFIGGFGLRREKRRQRERKQKSIGAAAAAREAVTNGGEQVSQRDKGKSRAIEVVENDVGESSRSPKTERTPLLFEASYQAQTPKTPTSSTEAGTRDSGADLTNTEESRAVRWVELPIQHPEPVPPKSPEPEIMEDDMLETIDEAEEAEPLSPILQRPPAMNDTWTFESYKQSPTPSVRAESPAPQFETGSMVIVPPVVHDPDACPYEQRTLSVEPPSRPAVIDPPATGGERYRESRSLTPAEKARPAVSSPSLSREVSIEPTPKVEAEVVAPINATVEEIVKASPSAPEMAVETPKREIEAPKAETPKVELTKVEAPKVETPKIEASKIEVPKVEAPKAEEVIEAPKSVEIEAPKPEIPQSQEPVTPKVEAPATPQTAKVEIPVPPAEEVRAAAVEDAIVPKTEEIEAPKPKEIETVEAPKLIEISNPFEALKPKEFEASKVEAPKAEAPKVEATIAATPAVEVPVVRAANIEAPAVEAPNTEVPIVEASKVEAPKAETSLEVSVEAPKVETHKAQDMTEDLKEELKNAEGSEVIQSILVEVPNPPPSICIIPPTPTPAGGFAVGVKVLHRTRKVDGDVEDEEELEADITVKAPTYPRSFNSSTEALPKLTEVPEPLSAKLPEIEPKGKEKADDDISFIDHPTTASPDQLSLHSDEKDEKEESQQDITSTEETRRSRSGKPPSIAGDDKSTRSESGPSRRTSFRRMTGLGSHSRAPSVDSNKGGSSLRRSLTGVLHPGKKKRGDSASASSSQAKLGELTPPPTPPEPLASSDGTVSARPESRRSDKEKSSMPRGMSWTNAVNKLNKEKREQAAKQSSDLEAATGNETVDASSSLAPEVPATAAAVAAATVEPTPIEPVKRSNASIKSYKEGRPPTSDGKSDDGRPSKLPRRPTWAFGKKKSTQNLGETRSSSAAASQISLHTPSKSEEISNVQAPAAPTASEAAATGAVDKGKGVEGVVAPTTAVEAAPEVPAAQPNAVDATTTPPAPTEQEQKAIVDSETAAAAAAVAAEQKPKPQLKTRVNSFMAWRRKQK